MRIIQTTSRDGTVKRSEIRDAVIEVASRRLSIEALTQYIIGFDRSLGIAGFTEERKKQIRQRDAGYQTYFRELEKRKKNLY